MTDRPIWSCATSMRAGCLKKRRRETMVSCLSGCRIEGGWSTLSGRKQCDRVADSQVPTVLRPAVLGDGVSQLAVAANPARSVRFGGRWDIRFPLRSRGN